LTHRASTRGTAGDCRRPRCSKRATARTAVAWLFDRENFAVLLPDATRRDRMPVAYQIASAFPRLLTYGVRFKF
jgi:hypothetical protein